VNRCVNQPCRKISSAGVLVKSWGIGLLNGPEDIAIESQGSVYVANYFNNRVEKFLGDGTFVAAWSSLGDENGQLSGPAGVVVDGTGYVYLADSGNNRVQIFSPLPPSPHTAGGSGGRCYLRWGRSVRSNFSLCGIFQWFGS